MGVMKKSRNPSLITAADFDTIFRRETPQEFLARGGRITKCPSKVATGVAPLVIYVDGHALPTYGRIERDVGLPHKMTVEDYDVAQRELVERGTDDGTATMWREHERVETRSERRLTQSLREELEQD